MVKSVENQALSHLLKEYSKTTVVPIIAHVVFDIMVYGDRIVAPWWIWS